MAVNTVRHETSLLVSAETVAQWQVARVEDLGPADFAFIKDLQAEIVIFGTGMTQRFPQPGLARALATSGAGVEIMDSKAACRTYNIIVAEGRRVAAALLVE